ncbi:hypothetical protein B0H14DRAFT_3880655 [Mycena olivaceomarginata]|nr:hypothetical protein B0H14DRAFT_3883609 [Mycena olivaceomarginata]KAJ7810372.1 hypothetical protein B0H14DRAFT_3880655 [Mycena olivaceomarginata]
MSDLPSHLLDSPPRPARPAPSEPYDSDDDEAPGSVNPRSSSPSTGRSTSNPLKRPAEDMEQYADFISRKKNFKPSVGQELKDFSQLPGSQQGIMIYALMLENKERMDAIAPMESVYRIPVPLEGRIERAAFLALVDPATPCYVQNGVPIARVTTYLEKHGLTPDIKNDKSKLPVIQKRSGTRLTHFRNVIKDLIGDSRGTVRDPAEAVLPGEPLRKGAVNIVDLTQSILLVGAKAASDAKLSLALVARVAYLRWVYEAIVVEKGAGAPTYWTGVDKRLEEIRVSKNGVPEAMSRAFGRFLTGDYLLYGDAFVEHLSTVSPSTIDDE